jgi:rhodanese-related sulfurtransferase
MPAVARGRIRAVRLARPFIIVSFCLVSLTGVVVNAGHENRDVATISAERLKLLIDAGEKFILIDLRPAKEFQEKRLAGSRSIPATELEKRLGEIPKSGRVVIYAATPSNDIPDAVFQLFEDERYKNIMVMLDGFRGWEKRKYPVETGAKK